MRAAHLLWFCDKSQQAIPFLKGNFQLALLVQHQKWARERDNLTNHGVRACSLRELGEKVEEVEEEDINPALTEKCSNETNSVLMKRLVSYPLNLIWNLSGRDAIHRLSYQYVGSCSAWSDKSGLPGFHTSIFPGDAIRLNWKGTAITYIRWKTYTKFIQKFCSICRATQHLPHLARALLTTWKSSMEFGSNRSRRKFLERRIAKTSTESFWGLFESVFRFCGLPATL